MQCKSVSRLLVFSIQFSEWEERAKRAADLSKFFNSRFPVFHAFSGWTNNMQNRLVILANYSTSLFCARDVHSVIAWKNEKKSPALSTYCCSLFHRLQNFPSCIFDLTWTAFHQESLALNSVDLSTSRWFNILNNASLVTNNATHELVGDSYQFFTWLLTWNWQWSTITLVRIKSQSKIGGTSLSSSQTLFLSVSG